MKTYYVDDLITELKEKKYCDELEVLCDESPIERIELGVKSSLNIVSIGKNNEELGDKFSDLEDKVSDLEDELDEVECRNFELRCDLSKVNDAFEDENLESNIKEYFEMHPIEKEIFNKLPISDLIDFIKTATNWYNIKKDIE